MLCTCVAKLSSLNVLELCEYTLNWGKKMHINAVQPPMKTNVNSR